MTEDGRRQGQERRDPAAKERRDAPRRQGLRALAATLPKVTRRALGKRGYAEGGLIADWADIVGQDIAARCRPVKLTAARPGRAREGLLVLRTDPGFALELQHLTPLVLQRVNGYFGYQAVARLKLRQGLAMPGSGAPTGPPERLLDPGEETALKAKVATVEDADLGAALERLGRAVHARPRR